MFSSVRSAQLTEREGDVFRAMIRHRRQSDAADELSISIWTLRNHIKNIKAKLRLSTADTVFRLLTDAGVELTDSIKDVVRETVLANPPS